MVQEKTRAHSNPKRGEEILKFHSLERLHSLERKYLKGHTMRVAVATIASVVALSGLVMILPFG
jgi:hypothetical protein